MFYLLLLMISFANTETLYEKFQKHIKEYNDEHEVLGTVGGYRFEFHHRHKNRFLLAVSDTPPSNVECHAMDVDHVICDIIKNSTESSKKLIHEIYNFIKNTHKTELIYTESTFYKKFKSKIALMECAKHRIYYLQFKHWKSEHFKCGKFGHFKCEHEDHHHDSDFHSGSWESSDEEGSFKSRDYGHHSNDHHGHHKKIHRNRHKSSRRKNVPRKNFPFGQSNNVANNRRKVSAMHIN